jgi:hypothetical protein
MSEAVGDRGGTNLVATQDSHTLLKGHHKLHPPFSNWAVEFVVKDLLAEKPHDCCCDICTFLFLGARTPPVQAVGSDEEASLPVPEESAFFDQRLTTDQSLDRATERIELYSGFYFYQPLLA